jgi:AcrR family transcriptional regulator
VLDVVISQTERDQNLGIACKPVRRTQDERSAATRESVIAAAFEILHHQGYSGATTYAIAKGAGVSLGALQHQFQTKAELMKAVLRRLLALRIQDYRRAIRGVQKGIPRFEALTRASWAMIGSKELTANMEIELAARNDEELAHAVKPMIARHANFMRKLLSSMLEGLEADQESHLARRVESIRLLNNAVMTGLSLEVVRSSDPDAIQDAVAIWRDFLITDLIPTHRNSDI